MARNPEILEAQSAVASGRELAGQRQVSLTELQAQYKTLATQYRSLQAKLKDEKATNEEYKSQIEEISAQLRAINDEKEAALLELEQIKAQQKHLEKTGQRQGQEYAAALAKIAELSTQISQLEGQNSLLSSELEELLEKNRLSAKENEENLARISELEDANSALFAETESLKRDKSEISSELDSLRGQLESTREEFSSLKETYEALREQHQTLEDQNLALKGEIASQSAKYSSLQTRYSELDQENTRNISSIRELTERLTLAESQRQRLEVLLADREREIQEITRQKEDKIASLDLLDAQNHQLLDQIREKTEENEALLQRIAQVEKALEDSSRENSARLQKAGESNAELEAELAQKQEEILRLKAAEAKQIREIRTLKDSQAEIERRLEGLSSEVQQKDERLQVLTSTSKALEKENSALNASIASLQQSVEDLQDNLARKEEVIASQREQFALFEEEVRVQRAESQRAIGSLEQVVAREQQASKALRDDLDRQSAEALEVKQSFAQLQKEKKELKSSSEATILRLTQENTDLLNALRGTTAALNEWQELYRVDFGQFKENVAKVTAELDQSGRVADYDPDFNPDDFNLSVYEEGAAVDESRRTPVKAAASSLRTPAKSFVAHTPSRVASSAFSVPPSPSKRFMQAIGAEESHDGSTRSSLDESQRGLNLTLAQELEAAGEPDFASTPSLRRASLRYEPTVPHLRLAAVAESTEERTVAGSSRRSLPVPGRMKPSSSIQGIDRGGDGEFSQELDSVNTPARSVGELPPIRSRHSSPSLVAASADFPVRPASREGLSPLHDRVPTPPSGERRPGSSLRRSSSSLSSTLGSSLDASRLKEEGRGNEHGSA